jgi:hypothetical protein
MSAFRQLLLEPAGPLTAQIQSDNTEASVSADRLLRLPIVYVVDDAVGFLF